jgi:metal-responsive CopG/Arc/MetJ family transcriptional regulator
MKQIALRLPLQMLVAIDNLRRERMDRPDRTSMIRELLAHALMAKKKIDEAGQ